MKSCVFSGIQAPCITFIKTVYMIRLIGLAHGGLQENFWESVPTAGLINLRRVFASGTNSKKLK